MATDFPSFVLFLKLSSLKNTLELKYYHHDLHETWKFLNENYTVHKLLFLKKLTCVPLCHKDFKIHLLLKINIKIFC